MERNNEPLRFAAPRPKPGRSQRQSQKRRVLVVSLTMALLLLILIAATVVTLAVSGKAPPHPSSPSESVSTVGSEDPASGEETSAGASSPSAVSSDESSETDPASGTSDPASGTSDPASGTSEQASGTSEQDKPKEPEKVTSFYAYTKPIKHETVYEKTDELEEGEEKVKQEGKDGEMKYTVKQIFTDGVLTYEDVWSEDVIKKPVTEIVLQGTKRTVTYDYYSYTKTREYKTVYDNVTDIPVGETKVIQEGKNAEIKYTVRQTYVNGKLTGEETWSEDVITEGQDKIIRRGVGGTFKTASGKEIAYSYKVTVTTTCYNGGEPGGKHSYTGKTLQYGMIAVDPKVIPLRKNLYIDCVADKYDGYFTSEDIGGGIKGNIIDVFFPTYAEAKAFHAVNTKATVYILMD